MGLRKDLEAFAAEVGTKAPVAVVGGRTHWEIGGLCPKDTLLVRAPTGVRSFDPAEMTVRVGAGTSVTELDAVLAEAGQRVNLPLEDLPLGDLPPGVNLPLGDLPPGVNLPTKSGATVGGVLAVGRDGIHALGRGRLRDTLLEAVYVADDGRLVTAGGPTVKNVSGFDLCRLLVGSLGTLGLLAEVVLRTWPRSPTGRWMAGECDPTELRRHLFRPSCILWNGSMAWVHLEGHEADVDSEAELACSLGCAPVDEPPPLPPHRVPAASTAANGYRGEFLVQVGTGSAYVHEPGPVPDPDPGVVVLNQRLKAQFDPRGRLNPGRDPLKAT